MKRALVSFLLLCAAFASAFGQSSGVPYFPQTLPGSTVVGRLSANPGATEAVPFSRLGPAISNNAVFPFLEIGSITVPITPFIDFHSSGFPVDYDARIFGDGGTSSTGQGRLIVIGNFKITSPAFSTSLPARALEITTPANSIAQGIYVNQSGSGTTSDSNLNNFNSLLINTDNVNAGANFVQGLAIIHNYGGSAALGGRNSLAVYSTLSAPTSVSNANRDYVSGAFITTATSGDGGGLGSEQGGVFGLSANGVLDGAAHIFNVTSMEANVAVKNGSSVLYKSIIQLVGRNDDAIQGSTYDVMLALSNAANVVKFQNGILFGNMNSAHPVSTTGTLIATTGSATVANGVDFSSYTMTGSLLKGPASSFVVAGDGTSMTLGGLNAGSYIGKTNTSNTPYLAFRSAATNDDYHVRLIASGGSGLGNGNLTLNAAGFTVTGTLALGVNTTTLGTLSLFGNTSGNVLITPQATAGTPTLILPNASGTFAISASGVLSLSATTGALTCSTCNAAASITGTTLASNVVTSSLTTVGTIGSGVWQGTKIGLVYGGTNADLSATGGTSQVLKQVSAGAAITVAQLAASDLSNGTSGSGAVALVTAPTFGSSVALTTSTNASLAYGVTNANAGASVTSEYDLSNGTQIAAMQMFGTGHSTSGFQSPGGVLFFTFNGGSGAAPLTFVTVSADPLVFGTTNTARLTIAAGGDITMTGNLTVQGTAFRLNQTPTAITSAAVTMTNGADAAANIGHRCKFNMNGTDYWFPCSTTAF